MKNFAVRQAVVDWDGASASALDFFRCRWPIQVVADPYSGLVHQFM